MPRGAGSSRATRSQNRRSRIRRNIIVDEENGPTEGRSTSSAEEVPTGEENGQEEQLSAGGNGSSDVQHVQDGSDIEYFLPTDSEDEGANQTRRDMPATSSSEQVSASSASPVGSGTTQSQLSPSLRLSRLAQRLSLARRTRRFINRWHRQRPVLEVDLVNNPAEPNDREFQGTEYVELDSDEEVEILRENPPERNEPSRNENLDERPDIDIINEVITARLDPPISVIESANQEVPSVTASSGNDAGPSSLLQGVSSNLLGTSSNLEGVSQDQDLDNDADGHSEDDDGPPQKMPRLETSVRSDEDDGCHICYEPYDNSGRHRPCCLKCGHIFGKDCIERWIKTQKRCPDCNSKAVIKDMRIIYVKNLKAIDTAELDRLKGEIEKMKIEKNKVELTNAQLRCQIQLKNQEIERLCTENNMLRSQPLKKESSENFNLPEPCTSAKAMESAASTSSGLRMPKLQLIKNFVIKEGQSRVGAYNEWLNLLVVSHAISNALFPNGCFGIRKINSLEMKACQSFPVHQRPIRDMAFCPSQSDLLLTVSLDKKAVLFNCNSNCPVQNFITPSSLWSCCWNAVNPNIFYVGSVTGQVMSYDLRAPQEPLSTLFIPTTDKSGVARLKFVPPAYQNQSFSMSGLLIQKLNSVWFCEMLGGQESDLQYHQLPLEGPFLNADFEPGSRHVLVSTRPKHVGLQRCPTTHTVCSLGKSYSEAESRNIFSCDVVQVMNGGFQESSIMCRSALFSPQQGQVYVAGNGEASKTVRVWDVANVEQKTLLRINQDAALDFVNGSINDTKFLGVIMENALDVYGIK